MSQQNQRRAPGGGLHSRLSVLLDSLARWAHWLADALILDRDLGTVARSQLADSLQSQARCTPQCTHSSHSVRWEWLDWPTGCCNSNARHARSALSLLSTRFPPGPGLNVLFLGNGRWKSRRSRGFCSGLVATSSSNIGT